MKILLLQDDFPPRSLGGPARVASELARGLHAEGHEVRVITSTPNKADVGEYEYFGMKVHAVYSKYAWRWQAYLSLYNPVTVPHVRKILAEYKPDVVHAHNIHYHISYHALSLAKQAGAKVLLTTHDVMLFHYGKLHDFYNKNDLSNNPSVQYKVSPWKQFTTYRFRYNPFRNLIIKHYLKYCDRLIAVSEELKKALSANDIYATDVIYTGIDTARWAGKQELRAKFRARYELEDRPTILFAGRLSEAKGGEQVLAMLGEVVKKIPNVLLLVAGREDEYAEKMKAKAENMGIKENILFTGWLEGDVVIGAYYAADVVVFPSVCFDTFGLVNIEAMAVEKPVVATCFGGAKEAVEDGITGTVINPGNTAAFTHAVVEFLTDPEKARVFGASGLKRVLEHFTMEEFVHETLELYND